MAEVFYFHVQEDRSIKYKLLEPIMQEDKDVATWRFRIPKALNQIDMSAWSWWFVYVNAKGQEYSELLTLTDDIDDPSSYSTADYDIDYGISKFPGSFSFALEAISTEQGGEISGEWHTKTYKHKVDSTLQGNQAEYAEMESDVISALMQEVRNKVNQLVGGATPLPVNLKSLMTDHDKVYLYTGSETGESTGYWYYYNGSNFVPGGLYGAGIQIDSTLSQSGQAADAKKTGDEITSLKEDLNDVESAIGFEILLPEINKSININTGVVLPSNVVTENGFCCLCVPCAENDVFNVTGKGGNNTQLWGFADSNGTVITKSGAGKTESNLKITAPTGSAYFAFNSYTNVVYGVTKGVSPVVKFDDIDTEISKLQVQAENIKNDLYEQTTILTDNSLHQFPIANGTTIVITTTDGTSLPEGNPYLQCFDSNGTFSEQFLCSSAYGASRTATISKGDVASVKMYSVPAKPIKVYVPDNNKLIPKVNEIAKSVGQDTIVVDASGAGDYTSFTQAIYDTVDSGIDVLVKPGTYDIVAEYVALFGQSAVDSMADSDSAIFNGFQYGVRLRKRKVKFAPGAHLVCDWTGHTVDGTHRFSALGVDYNVEIIGLDLDAAATFYCIHDDYGISTPYTVKYENCRVVGHNITNADCIGGGCKKYSRHILNNCYFNNNLTGSATVRYHNTNAEGAEPEIYVSNCYFNNWFTPRWYGLQTSKMRVYVNNCHARAIYKMAESSSYDVDNVELYKWNNEETDPRT